MDDSTFQDQSGSQTQGQTQGQTQTQIQPQTGGATGQTQDGVVVKDPKDDLPEVSEEEVKQFDMRSFDPALKPDLTTLANDSLGQALGVKPEDNGAMMTTAQQFEAVLNKAVPPHGLTFNEKEFKELLAGSISLLYEEKVAIIDRVSSLSQFQIDQLVNILQEEKKKFAALNKKHSEELKKLEAKQSNPEEKAALQKEEEDSKMQDKLAAEELLRKLQGF